MKININSAIKPIPIKFEMYEARPEIRFAPSHIEFKEKHDILEPTITYSEHISQSLTNLLGSYSNFYIRAQPLRKITNQPSTRAQSLSRSNFSFDIFMSLVWLRVENTLHNEKTL